MSFLENRLKLAPTGLAKIFYINWALLLVLTAIAAIGWVMLYSIAGGNIDTWAMPQIKRFGLGMVILFAVAFVPIWFWRSMSGVAYGVSILLLLIVEFFGTVGMGAQPVGVVQAGQIAKAGVAQDRRDAGILPALGDQLAPQRDGAGGRPSRGTRPTCRH